MSEDVTPEVETQPTEEEQSDTPLSEQVQNEIRGSFERGYSEGYAAGQAAQRTEDAYHVGRADNLARLLSGAEAEVQRLLKRLNERDQTSQ